MAITDADIVRAATSLGIIGGGAHTAHRILATLCDASLDARQIADVIQREPGLAVRVLKVANSAFYGSSRHIATLDRALMLLGLDAVRGIAAAACLDRSVARRTPGAAIDTQALAHHCVASAFAAEALTKQSGRAIPAEAFMAALLHDFGLPVQERLDSPGVVKLMEALAADPDASFKELEESLVEVGHAHCAEVVFDHWHLPQGIVFAARYHDDPMQAPGPARQLSTLVYLGVQLALLAGFTHSLEPHEQHIAREPLLRSVGLTESVVDPIVAGLSERVLLVVEPATA